MRRPSSEPIDDVEELAATFRKSELPPMPNGWHMEESVFEAHRKLAREFIAAMPEPGPMEGRGIVICGGGSRYFTCAYVNIRMLRSLGCTLPIELWHYEEEVDDRMSSIVAEHGVRCVNADEFALPWMHRPLKRGYELKPFALCATGFREILLLDSDNVPIRDPSFLFDTLAYKETGAIFWPDYGRLAPDRDVWRACEVQYRDEPEHETGQIVVDKGRNWKPLALAMHYNDHSEFYYHFQLGDKDLFHMAFHRLGVPYSMPRRGIHSLNATMCQHDFENERLFQHRNFDKWKIEGGNVKIDGFVGEDDCFRFLAELREKWSGVVWGRESDKFDSLVVGKQFTYERVGHDVRPMTFNADGSIGMGWAGCETRWSIRSDGALIIGGGRDVTCILKPTGDGAWKGRWARHERMPTEVRETR